MEAQFDDQSWIKILKYIVYSPNVFMITTFLGFLEPEELTAVAEVGLVANKTHKFYRIAVARMFVNCYLNRVDRSNFFLFYEEPEFQNMEKTIINALAYNHYQFLQKSCYSFRQIFRELTTRTQFMDLKEELKELLDALFFDPDVPMPKMKRETIGMYCQTPFQQFLCLQHFEEENDGQQFLEECLQELQQKFQLEVSLGVHANDLNLQQKMETVRFRGWLVDAQHMNDYFIDNFHSHNFLVLLLALSSELVETYFMLLKNINDPFMRFIEFNLRSTIFRNIVLSIEDRLAFAIRYYDRIYDNLYHVPPGIPKFCFWRAGLSIWGQKMSGYHADNKKIYDYITGKLRENSLLGYLGSKTQRLPSVYSELRDEAQLNGFSHVLKDHAYLETRGALDFEAFLDENEDIYNVLAKDYLEYSLDMSINEISVHWCGHSLHSAEDAPICKQISSGFIESSLRYYNYLKSKIRVTIPPDLHISIFREILKEDINFVSQNIAKPFVLRQLCDLSNDMIKQWLQSFEQFQVFIEEAMYQNRVQLDFQEKDNLLMYFAKKAEIPDKCPDNLQFYYNVQKNPQAQIPKQVMEDESDLSEGVHEIYDSENESI